MTGRELAHTGLKLGLVAKAIDALRENGYGNFPGDLNKRAAYTFEFSSEQVQLIRRYLAEFQDAA